MTSRSLTKISVYIIMFFISGIIASSAFAEESSFGYTFTTDMLPKGQKEIMQWITIRHKKAHGYFDLVETKTEFEYGIRDNLQLSISANYAYSRAYHNSVDYTTMPPETFAGYDVRENQKWNAHKLTGVSLGAIYRILSPYKNPIGLALILEGEIGDDLRELEERVVLQKNFLDDRLLLAVNVSLIQEGRWLPADEEVNKEHWDHETDMNIDAGISYRFAPNWSIGWEVLNEREFSSFNLKNSDRTNIVYLMGPVIQYGSKNFFISATILEQMPWGSDLANPSPGAISGGRNYADDFERYRLRIKTGYYF